MRQQNLAVMFQDIDRSLHCKPHRIAFRMLTRIRAHTVLGCLGVAERSKHHARRTRWPSAAIARMRLRRRTHGAVCRQAAQLLLECGAFLDRQHVEELQPRTILADAMDGMGACAGMSPRWAIRRRGRILHAPLQWRRHGSRAAPVMVSLARRKVHRPERRHDVNARRNCVVARPRTDGAPLA